MSELTDRLRTAYEGFGRRDLQAVLSVMDPEIEWDATDALAHTGLYYGHDGVTEYIESLTGVWEEFELNPEQFTESGDGAHVMVLGSVKGRLAANGQDVEARFAHVLQLEDGKVTRLKVCLDRDAALREMPESQAT
ncbi:MAG: nuclear transport factor 2 family protein [Thermoleophilaceae bacterium]